MAFARKCDVCGKLYERRKLSAEIMGVKTVHVTDSYDKYYDLCDECLDKISVILSGVPERKDDLDGC